MAKSKKIFSKSSVIVLDLAREETLYEGIFEEAKKLGYGILDLNYTRKTILPGINVAGLLTKNFYHDSLISRFREQGLKVVRLGRYPVTEKTETLPSVLPDLTKSGQIAADHFIDRQFRNIGFIGNYPWREEPYVYNGFKKQAKKRGCKCFLLQTKYLKKYNTNREKQFEYRMKQILEWLKKLPKPVGVFTYNDVNAAAIFSSARLGGVNIPEEVAILGMGNISLICNFLPVPLSSVDMNDTEKGRVAVILLHRLIHGYKEPAGPIMISPKEVIDRQSTNMLAVPDPVVSKALRFIWDNFKEQLSIEDIARATGVAKSTLSWKFRKHLNHGVNAELRRKRLEHAKTLLKGSLILVEDIAIESGFPNISYFYRAFRKTFNTTPEKFRKKYIISQNTNIEIIKKFS